MDRTWAGVKNVFDWRDGRCLHLTRVRSRTYDDAGADVDRVSFAGEDDLHRSDGVPRDHIKFDIGPVR